MFFDFFNDDDLRKLKRAFLEIDYNKKETTKGRDGDGIGHNSKQNHFPSIIYLLCNVFVHDL